MRASFAELVSSLSGCSRRCKTSTLIPSTLGEIGLLELGIRKAGVPEAFADEVLAWRGEMNTLLFTQAHQMNLVGVLFLTCARVCG